MKTVKEQYTYIKQLTESRLRQHAGWISKGLMTHQQATNDKENLQAICATIQKLVYLQDIGDEITRDTMPDGPGAVYDSSGQRPGQ